MTYEELADQLNGASTDRHDTVPVKISFLKQEDEKRARRPITESIPGSEIARVMHSQTESIGVGVGSALTVYWLKDLKSITITSEDETEQTETLGTKRAA